MQVNKAILGDGWRLLERHEEIREGDQTGRASLLRSNINFEDWQPVADWSLGMTVNGALTDDMDRSERVFRRRVAPAADLERARAEAWNEAVEACAKRLEERAQECWSGPTTLSGTMRHVYGEEATIIRALKRTT